MRLPRTGDLRQLGQVTRARELAALAELASIAVEKRGVEDRIVRHKAGVPACYDAAQAATLSRWLDWREDHVRRLSSRLALIMADYARASQVYGRAVAENAVMEDLERRASARDADQTEKRTAFQPALDLAQTGRLHLLPHDFGDQDV